MTKNRWVNNELNYGQWLFVLLCLLGTLYFTSAAHAQTAVSIPLEQEFKISEGSLAQEAQKGVYILEALEAGNPMPNGEMTYHVQLAGNESKTIEGFDFSAEGTFSYKLYQRIPANKAGFTYDKQVYLITVYATRSANELNVEVVVKNDQKLKVMSAAFVNTYAAGTSGKESGGTSDSLPVTKQKRQSFSERLRRLPSTGQLKEHIWLLGLVVLTIAVGLYQQKQRADRRK